MPLELVNDHLMYWETHGEGDWALCMGGWGSFCHGEERHVPRALLHGYRVLVFDYPGIGESAIHQGAEPSTAVYAQDVIALCDRLGINRLHVVGMVGMGGCVAQQLALAAPTLVRSLTLMGTWARVDPLFADQLEMFRRSHELLGFEGFQLLAAVLSFAPGFYAQHRHRILGPQGTWAQLNGRYEAHARLIEACLQHDVLERLGEVAAPTLIVHAGSDVVTAPRLTRPIEAAIPDARGFEWPEATHILAGRDQKVIFDRLLVEHLDDVNAAS